MKILPGKIYAVLTGDVVDSSKMSPDERRELPAMLRQASHRLRQAYPHAVPLDVDVFRGDGWQLLVGEPALSLRIGLYFRAGIIASSAAGRRRDTRIALAEGGVDFLPAKRVSEGDGEAYRLSGQALDALREPERMRFAERPGSPPGRAVVVRLVDALANDWTAPQARSVLGRLQGWTQAQIAQLWPKAIAQQAVAKHLEKAHWPALENALAWIEQIPPGL